MVRAAGIIHGRAVIFMQNYFMRLLLDSSRALLRLIALLIIAFGLVGLPPVDLLLLGGALLSWVIVLQRDVLKVWWLRLSRLRWFFLAIFILYLLGGPPGAGAMAWVEAGYRVGVLVVLVGAVAVCLHDLPAAELAQGLGVGLGPLARFGLPVESFSRRLAGTLDAVARMDESVRRVAQLDRELRLRAIAQICRELESASISPGAPDLAGRRAAQRDVVLLLLCGAGIAALQLS